jgi:hypothetical protein
MTFLIILLIFGISGFGICGISTLGVISGNGGLFKIVFGEIEKCHLDLKLASGQLLLETKGYDLKYDSL